jgi:apolipoprotein N-acyltransferase
LPQSNKLGWPLADQLVALDRWLALTAAVGSSDRGAPDVIVWPETMKPGLTLDDESVRAEREAKLSFSTTDENGVSQQYSSLVFTNDLLNFQKRLGVPMLIGEDAYTGLRFDFEQSGVDINYTKRFNSVFLVKDGTPDPKRYDKIRLTPFGEEMPHIDAWPWLKKTMLDVAAKGMRLDLSHGSDAVVFDIPTRRNSSFRAATPICYEITETSLVRRFIQNGAEVLIHVTNDGWFGDWTIGKREHLDICRWRALEFGVPVVRSANTGISAVIDDLGRVIDEGPAEKPSGSNGTNTEGTLLGSVQLRPELRTVYTQTGNLAGWAGFGVGATVIVLALAIGRPKPNPPSAPNASV